MTILQIVIPYYGSQKLLEQAIDSVIQQSSPKWELYILDDNGSKFQNSSIDKYSNFAKIHLIQNEKNLGISKNFIKAIEIANSKYLTIMGCDDVLLPNYVERCLELFKIVPAASYLQPGVEVIDEHGDLHLGLPDKVKKMLMKQPSFPAVLEGEQLAKSLATGCWTYFPSLCWNTSVIKKYGFRSDFSIVLDMDLQMRIIADGGSLVVDDKPVFQYRRHRASASMTAAVDGKRFREERQLYTELENTFASKGWKKARKAAQWRLTSRLNAGLHLMMCLLTFKFSFVPGLWRHTFG